MFKLALKNYLSGSCQGDTFSLTPALSRWERGNGFQRLGKSTAGFCSTALEFYGCSQRLFPLPRGEGQGEGKARKPI